MYPDETFPGVVESVSPASGTAFSLLPPENATGNWVKVTQRFPVRVRVERTAGDPPLRIGASCSVTIDTTRVVQDTRLSAPKSQAAGS
jgi:membrane fusion protein (multidrug efflux system)